MPPSRPRTLARVLVAVLALASACGGGTPREPTTPTTAVGLPDDPEVRHEAIDRLGRRAWGAMAEGEPGRLLIDDLGLRNVLDAAAATRLSARRLETDHRLGSTEDFGPLLEGADYAGICLQGARAEPAGGVLGLQADGWIFDRFLLIGRRPSGRRIAAWVEGVFVYTDAGFTALDLERVEEPRWEHSDLEIAPCDLSIRNDLPERAR